MAAAAVAAAVSSINPRQDFPAWLAAHGVSLSVAEAVDRELGIGDYEAFLACAEQPHVRAELFAAARERLPFAFYAVLRRVTEASSPKRHDGAGGAGGVLQATAAATAFQPFLSGLLDAIVLMLNSLSQELLQSAERFSCLEPALYPNAVEEGLSPYLQEDDGGEVYETDAPAVPDGPPEDAQDNQSQSWEDGGKSESEAVQQATDLEDMEGTEQEWSGYNVKMEHYDNAQARANSWNQSGENETEADDGGYSESSRHPSETGRRMTERQAALHRRAELANRGSGGEAGSWSSPVAAFPPGAASPWASRSRIQSQGSGGGRAGSAPPRAAKRRRSDTGHKKIIESDPVEPQLGASNYVSRSLPLGSHSNYASFPYHADVHGSNNNSSNSNNSSLSLGQSCEIPTSSQENAAALDALQRAEDSLENESKYRAYTQYRTIDVAGGKEFQCEQCEESFPHLHMMRVHLRKHTGEKLYTCEYCGKEFIISNNLARHRRTHTGEKPFVCDVCGKKFCISYSLIRHKKTHEQGGGGEPELEPEVLE
ncbi:uncharacterized protein LOC116949686 isoform X2 [Petromyzon marinus]|uniref:Zinc finger and SCAN domain-containing protein 21-like isoform X2 n=1 Tax=Petromyzon marinus TaxID=7757 RepID=A0AAJ7X6S9_PETMA|nr:zinc finger and SCAN domain-containing protein 21-like isoform X2 [Petromyzon marinus]